MIGEFKQRITIVRNVRTATPTGGSALSQVVVADVWAKANGSRANALSEGGKVSGETSMVFTFLYNNALFAELSTDCSIVYKGQFYKVNNAENVGERDVYIRVSATSQGAATLV